MIVVMTGWDCTDEGGDGGGWQTVGNAVDDDDDDEGDGGDYSCRGDLDWGDGRGVAVVVVVGGGGGGF
ncbi:unnamed protein product [Dibothriocephalus latus]|uniref:Uncharacterized protein n=1 Tax=Dibothriocephalus latus TaxID=60516 RepID=A0A3P6UPY6_DIBLA|nr:unnamed protein product [Dibothriocephalus latus]